ncbi:MAG: hypothetical protein OXR66_07985 [Candidatus Woesearchaeota archaeon]|nr:hypothetical protein [Candidatus Woesearchaeota archaeon]
MDIQLTTAMPVPSLIRTLLRERAARLIEKHRHRFGNAFLSLHVKRVGKQVGCSASLFTDDGKYHSHVEGWDVRRVADDALDSINNQVLKYFGKKLVYA